MTPHQIVVVGLRLGAVLWAWSTVAQIFGLVFGPFGEQRDESIVVGAIVAALQLAICITLWFFPATLATKLLPSPKNDIVSEAPTRSDEWLALGLVVIGAWMLAGAIADAFYWILVLTLGSFDRLEPGDQAAALATVFELGIGVGLIAGAKGLSDFLWKIRTGGVSKG